MTVELPWRQVINRSVSKTVVCNRVKAINSILWDNASISSRRMFEMVNLLHHDLTDEQLILVGVFLQLRPVPDMCDKGCYMFEFPLFEHAISHTSPLTKVMRQSAAPRNFFTHSLKSEWDTARKKLRHILTARAENCQGHLKNVPCTFSFLSYQPC